MRRYLVDARAWAGNVIRAALALCILELLLPALVGAAPLPEDVLPQLRRLLGVQRPVAVAGTRSLSDSSQLAGPQVCLVSPLRRAGSELVARTSSGSPAILSREPLVEVLIYDGLTMLARVAAPPGEVLPQPLAWPLPSMALGTSLDVWLRPVAVERSYAVIQLDRPLAANAPQSDAELQIIGHWDKLLQAVLGGDQAARQQMQALINQACRISL